MLMKIFVVSVRMVFVKKRITVAGKHHYKEMHKTRNRPYATCAQLKATREQILS